MTINHVMPDSGGCCNAKFTFEVILSEAKNLMITIC